MDILSYAAATKRIIAIKDSTPVKFIPDGAVAITFDDGFLENYTKAHPLLKARGIPATMFACSDWVMNSDGTSGWCSPAQLLQLQNEGWEIGAHSKTHPNLSQLTDQGVDDEARLSKEALESAGLKISTFALPFGGVPNNLDILFKYYDAVAQSVGAITPLPLPHPYYYRYWPNNEQGFTVQNVKDLIINAEKRGGIVVLGFHRFGTDNSGNAWPQSHFEELINWLDPDKCFTFKDIVKAKEDPSKRILNKYHYTWGRCDAGTSTGSLVFDVNAGYGWDYNDRSIGLDLKTPRSIQGFRIKTIDTVTPRLIKEKIEVWYSNDNLTFKKYNGAFTFYHYLDAKTEDNRRSILIQLSNAPKSRYWKIHQKMKDTNLTVRIDPTNEFSDVWINQNFIKLS